MDIRLTGLGGFLQAFIVIIFQAAGPLLANLLPVTWVAADIERRAFVIGMSVWPWEDR
jgi:hypothetical protein